MMAVFAGHGIPGRWGVLTRLKAATGSTALDRRLARGADALRAEPPGDVHGIAGVSLLLTDGAGPLSTKYPAGTLNEAAFRAAFHLEAG